MSAGPTTGAVEAEGRVWHSSPVGATAIRLAAFLLPLAFSLAAVHLVANLLWRPPGWFGFTIWILQISAVGLVVSMAVDLITKNMLPLAALLNMTLVFPDEAPSRFSVALRAGSARKLRARANAVTPLSKATNPNEAATAALALVSELALHDRKTRGHTERVRAYSDLIGAEMGLTEDQRVRLSWAGLLHDVGKMTVPSEILNKRGRPNETEWAILSSHASAGGEMLAPLADWLGEWVLAAAEHHERWDGNGYPLGLKGEEISLAGRIVAVADAFDVITSKRSYKNPMSHEAARRELVACSGSQFDPGVVRAFLNVSLGRRWLVGPFAWLAELPLGSVGGTVARIPVAAAGAVVAVTAVTFPAQAGSPSEDLAFTASSVVVPSMPTTAGSRVLVPTTNATELEVDTTTTSMTEVETTTTTQRQRQSHPRPRALPVRPQFPRPHQQQQRRWRRLRQRPQPRQRPRHLRRHQPPPQLQQSRQQQPRRHRQPRRPRSRPAHHCWLPTQFRPVTTGRSTFTCSTMTTRVIRPLTCQRFRS